MTTPLNGLLGGLLIGLVAGVATRFVGTDPSVAAALLERAVGDRAAGSRWWALASHVLYGGLAGVGFLALELFVLQVLAVPPTVGEALGAALAWAALLLVVWVVVWSISSDLTLDRSSLGALLAYHLVFGLGFGLWIRVTWIT